MAISRKKIDPHILFRAQLKSEGIPEPHREYVFNADRKWRFDYCWPDAKVALEVEGGIWTGGRHSRGVGMLADMQKYNNATLMGWRLFRCTPDQLPQSSTLALVRAALQEGG